MTGRCETCRFWRRVKHPEPMGTCRTRPPVALAAGNPNAPSGWGWPVTKAEDWCGKYQARED